MSSQPEQTKGSSTAAAVSVAQPGSGAPLAGPGTGRTHSEVLASRGERPTSYDPADFAPLTGREEDWRFTPLKRLAKLHEADGDGGAPADGSDKIALHLPEGATAVLVGQDDPRVRKAGAPIDRTAALAFAAVKDVTVVTVTKEAVLTEPVRLEVNAEGGTAYAHVVFDVKPFAEAVIVLDHKGTGARSANVDLIVGDSAKVTFVSVQDWDRDAVHLAQQNILVGRDATVKSVNVTFGGDLVRITPNVRYTAPGGDAELLGLYFADDGQHLEHRLFVDHSVTNCRSHVTYKGALQGADAHTVWVGDVLIRAAAEATDTYELNRNLLLTDGARADSVPNLEIETGEIVGAGHASATGRFDDEQLFYLQARGIPEAEARRLVVRGFFADVVRQIGIPELEEQLMAKVEQELAQELDR
ncbi:Fe-S cluster assembly protein SufD [Actinospica sp. MGRD01-02]|uniref:Fe-S cluster assembly protein SufD n=1 Tax=Actinospica acidithermotolerans TaxID=2828514 RepID=A0A941E316_9ACTN|nr:Fe-S cluster assembly protein SufD [Actinospica acidithermotolerans]MBR7825260.1 Fe-S cluster assembly protein SufD [Actinospica acidithermotolerans]